MENHSFEYTYSPQRQQEVEEIRKHYLPPVEDKLAQLRRLHRIPTRKAQALSIIIGVLGALILGTGMSLCMTELGTMLGALSMALGVTVGLVGIAGIALAYPVYARTLKKERAKIAPEILRMADELSK